MKILKKILKPLRKKSKTLEQKKDFNAVYLFTKSKAMNVNTKDPGNGGCCGGQGDWGCC